MKNAETIVFAVKLAGAMLVTGTVAILPWLAPPATAQLERILRDAPKAPGASSPASGLSNDRIAAGLKEALQVGTENTVSLTGKTDGYFRNQAIKILMPDSLRTAERGLRAAGLGGQIDEFVLSMNRAAERAAPAAKQIFWDAITAMSFDDVRRILSGGDTAATEYFKTTTTDKLAAAFRPVVERAMNDVGVTRQYKELAARAQAVPFVKAETIDIDQYVVGKALDGLFVVLGDEERKIRTNPTARGTELLKEVFAR